LPSEALDGVPIDEVLANKGKAAEK
jgi:hypothetical protein